ncbi:MAG: CPBP family intramembrane metalloprotease [Clostridia bacterium]|nr:CPBP family intramembrane metalloprotease [Clostridia bacterium]
MKEEKSKPSIFDNIIFYTLTVLLLVFGGQLIGVILLLPITYLTKIGVISETPELSIALDYFSTIGCWAICLLWFLFKKNRFMYGELKPKKSGNTIPMFIVGCIVGFVMNALCILTAWLNGDVSFEYDSFKPVWLVILAVCILIQSSSEEVICRVYLYQKIKNRYKNPIVAVIANSVIFSCLHLMNPGVSVIGIVNIALIGTFISLFIYYFDSFWCASAIHAAWNFTQNIIFGLPNSGNISPFSMFKLTAARDSFAYNKDFGVEATIISLIMEIVGITVVIVIGRKYRSSKLLSKQTETANEVKAEV